MFFKLYKTPTYLRQQNFFAKEMQADCAFSERSHTLCTSCSEKFQYTLGDRFFSQKRCKQAVLFQSAVVLCVLQALKKCKMRRISFAKKKKPHKNRIIDHISYLQSRWVVTFVHYMSTGSPEGKEAYTPHKECTSLIRSVGKKMIRHASHRAFFFCNNIITHFKDNFNSFCKNIFSSLILLLFQKKGIIILRLLHHVLKIPQKLLQALVHRQR